MKKRNVQRVSAWTMYLFLLPALLWGSPTADPYSEINENWDRFGAVYGRILDYYFTDLNHEDIMRAAIDGMLEELDTYSQFYDAEGLRQLRQDTTGKFAGLGITVAIKDRYPVIIAPIEGSPAFRAGLAPGDLIVEVEGRDTFDLGLEEIVHILRGEPGTSVHIRVASKRGAPGRELALEREVITIKSVALTEMVHQGIGYISMRHTRFSEYTAAEVEEALVNLKEEGVEGLILDLRGNPGGLLSQATRVADLFLPKDAPIVSIRERNGRREEVRYSQRNPIAGDLPLVILIDEGSASASEIVAGAIQDNDRGVILGSTSFGKGSVQTIFDLHETRDSALKLTTAKYYTPSGRSIHRESHTTMRNLFSEVLFSGIKLPAGTVLDLVVKAEDLLQARAALQARFDLVGADADQVLAASLGSLVGNRDGAERLSDSLEVSSEETVQSFYTSKKREVFGGGGINPDIEVAADNLPGYVTDLNRRRLFFDFVVDYVAADSSLIQMAEPEVDQAMMEAFTRYLVEKIEDNEFHRPGQQELKNLKNMAAELQWNAAIRLALEQLELEIEADFLQSLEIQLKPHIRAGLKRELALRLKGKSASLRVELETDPQLWAAINLLIDVGRYSQLLQVGTS